jgi:hypothetical protein
MVRPPSAELSHAACPKLLAYPRACLVFFFSPSEPRKWVSPESTESDTELRSERPSRRWRSGSTEHTPATSAERYVTSSILFPYGSAREVWSGSTARWSDRVRRRRIACDVTSRTSQADLDPFLRVHPFSGRHQANCRRNLEVPILQEGHRRRSLAAADHRCADHQVVRPLPTSSLCTTRR